MSKINLNKKEIFLGLISILILFMSYSYSEVSILSFLKVLLGYIGYVFLPGLFFYKLTKVNFPNILFYKIIISNVLGLFFIFLIDFIAIKINNSYILLIIPLIVSILNFFLKAENSHKSVYEIRYFGYLLLFIIIINSIHIMGAPSLEKVEIFDYFTSDKFWHAGNSYSFNINFFPPDIHVKGLLFKYHFFDDWIVSILNKITGVSTVDISFYYIIPVYLTILCFSMYSIGQYFFKKEEKYIVFFILSTLFISSVSASITLNYFEYHIFKNPNAILPAFCIFIIVNLLVIEFLKNKKYTIIQVIILLISLFVLAGFKSVFALLIPVILFCVLIVNIFLKKHVDLHILKLFALTLFTYVSYHYIILGIDSISSVEVFVMDTINVSFPFGKKILDFTGLNDFFSFLLIPLHFFMFIPFQGILLLISLGLFFKNFTKSTDSELYIYGMSFSGIVLMYILYHEGMSHFYFMFGSLLFINILSILCFKKLYESKIKGSYLLTYGLLFLAAILFTKQIVLDISNNFRYANITYTIDDKGIITLEEKQALEWLKKNSDTKDIFATNRHYLNLNNEPILGDKKGRFYYYTAFSGRQAFIEGYFYTQRKLDVIEEYGVKKQYFQFKDEIYLNMQKNDSIFNRLNVESIMIENNIKFIVNNKRSNPNLNSIEKENIYLSKVFENKIITIYKLKLK